VSDVDASVIWKVTPAGQKSILAGLENEEGTADGAGGAARFNAPRGLSLDKDGNLFVADSKNHRIRKITPAGVVSTVAGTEEGYENGAAGAAKFKLPEGVTVDRSGWIYVADTGNHRLRQVSPTGEVKNLVGTGEAASVDGTGERTVFNGPPAKLNGPSAIALLSNGDLLVTERGGNCVKKIAMGTQFGAVIAGDSHTAGFVDGDGATAQFKGPGGVVVDKAGNIFVAERDGHRIRKIVFTAGL
jgi:DNA-binding beta-propeller fold protein YncE